MKHVGKMRVGELRCRQSENKSFHYMVPSPLGKMLLVTPALFPASHILGGWQSLRIKPRPSGLRHQCSATELQQPDNQQSSQSTIHTAQVVVNASVTWQSFFQLFSPAWYTNFACCVGVWVCGLVEIFIILLL